tara:strand:+ start:1405 stop:1965 length:561 start_codon:yes stop_codon:yes gene_type:complete
MADITIKVSAAASPEEEEKEPQAVATLQIRKTLDGNVVIFDHDVIDIVINPSTNKISTFAKNTLGDYVYNAQDRLFDFLAKKGVIKPESVKGGNVYGSIEAEYPESDSEGTNSLQTVIFVISRFVDLERPFFNRIQDHLEDFEENMLEPDEKDSTELGEVPHGDQKGSMRPHWIRSPYAHTRYYRG